MAVLGFEFLDHDFGFLDLCGIKLALDRQAHFVILERVENVRFADGLITVVLDPANDRAARPRGR